MTPELLRLARRYASAALPRESCGLIVVQAGSHIGDYLPVRNLATEEDRFTIAPEDWARAEDTGRVACIVHSHPQGTSAPSEWDRVACDLSGLPWLILGGDMSWQMVTPVGRPPEGREFCWGVDDCYSLVREWLGIKHDFLRTPDFWRERDLFGEGLASAGFRRTTDDPRPGDGLLFNVHGRHPDHCAVYLGDGRMLHQPSGRLSVVEPVGQMVEKIHQVVRRAA